uniref:Mitochondrial import inner membrane translocase subunit Tim21 n=1 Tax=Spermophilus dauricus TaxID=99837 RepID=A0A8C9Q9Q3_SPEDA
MILQCAFVRGRPVVLWIAKLCCFVASLSGTAFSEHDLYCPISLKTQPSLRWGLREPKKTAPPRSVLGLVQKTIWTQGPSPCNAQEDRRKQVSVHRDPRAETAVSTSQKVKEAGRDFTYLVIVVIGIGITGGLFYTIFRELFSSSSPSKVYGKALEKCRSHPEVSSLMRGRTCGGDSHLILNMLLILGFFSSLFELLDSFQHHSLGIKPHILNVIQSVRTFFTLKPRSVRGMFRHCLCSFVNEVEQLPPAHLGHYR